MFSLGKAGTGYYERFFGNLAWSGRCHTHVCFYYCLELGDIVCVTGCNFAELGWNVKINTVRGELEVLEDANVAFGKMVWSHGRVDDWPGAGALLETIDKEFSQLGRGYDLSGTTLSLGPANFTDLLAELLSQ